jgi:NADH-ubiquinone oxidoreductase chain 5
MYIEDVHDAPIKMVIPLVFLAFGSIFWGFLSRDLFIGLGTTFFSSSVFIFSDNLLLIDSEFSLAILKNIPLVFTLLCMCLSFLLINCSLTSKDIIYSFKIDTA